MIRRIHHINFIVRDLGEAVGRYRKLFGDPVAESEELPQRGVRLARFRLADAWLILVQPLTEDSVPGRYLQQHGEGFFLLSCQVDDVRRAAEQAEAAGIGVTDMTPRHGLDDWRVIDLDPDDLLGVNIQLVSSSAATEA